VREGPAGNVLRPTQYGATGQALLLDTHVWIWWLEKEIARTADGSYALLARASASGDLLVSDISCWEVSLKAAKGKLRLPMDAGVWLNHAERAPGIRYVPLSREVLLQSTRLAGTLHADPADRMLVATAQLLGVPLVTADRAIIEYALAYSGMVVIDVRRR